ncbi:hypothetical protein NL676_018758 [Syzygium grande]|nr:hypothetical protein NL676_018758 [Syzygium grande]
MVSVKGLNLRSHRRESPDCTTICDNCASAAPASACRFTDNLILCQDCDWDAHVAFPVPSSHHRSRIDGFSSCPSALELASL